MAKRTDELSRTKTKPPMPAPGSASDEQAGAQAQQHHESKVLTEWRESFDPMKLDDGSTSTPESRAEYTSTLFSLMSDLWDEDLKEAEAEIEAEIAAGTYPYSSKT